MNSTFLRRLKYYGIGFGLGVIVVTFLLPNRSCSWTPSNRVKNMLLGRFITINEIEKKLLDKKGITNEDVISVLNDGNVDFSKSKKEGDTKVYVIEKNFKNKGKFQFYFTLPDESFISEVKIGEENAFKVQNTTEGYGYFISFPKDDYLIYPDSTQKVQCQMRELKIGDVKQLYLDLQKTGKINFEQTHFKAKPKAEHQLEYIKNNDTIAFQSVWYKNKVFVSNFISEKTKDCIIKHQQ